MSATGSPETAITSDTQPASKHPRSRLGRGSLGIAGGDENGGTESQDGAQIHVCATHHAWNIGGRTPAPIPRAVHTPTTGSATLAHVQLDVT
jgi:hypothetical protein